MPGSSVQIELTRDVLIAANVNPETGLATDYLNAFNEPLMLIGLAGSEPAILDELTGWRPVSYVDHFAGSEFQARDVVIAAYRAAPVFQRAAFERVAGELGEAVLDAIATLRSCAAAGGDVEALAEHVSAQLQEQSAGLDAMIHGGAANAAQDDIDALFD